VLRERFGTEAPKAALRALLAEARARRATLSAATLLDQAADALAEKFRAHQRPVLNLTGTVLHTNLGRAPLPPEAAEAAAQAMRSATSLEFDLATGRRGERDEAVRDLLRSLTGAEDATVVNNNAAALVLALNTFSRNRETLVSRGELIEIGGSFRLPAIMAQSGARLREVGTTNRTHAADYEAAQGPRTGAILRVHWANFTIAGFTASAPDAALAACARVANVPFINDLGSGSLIDLALYGLPPEPTPRAALEAGADLVTFSGDKLLGGPQAGLIVGKASLIARLNRNPLKRALRLDKARLAALEAVLRLYLMPDRLAESLPALRLLTRPEASIRATAQRLAPVLQAVLGEGFTVQAAACRSQIGSGALPVDLLPSWALSVAGRGLAGLAARLRALPTPVIGRIADDRLWLDLRCLEAADEAVFTAQLPRLA
jgi:L-seryl-tRNA(Ser) seleniumtransferase